MPNAPQNWIDFEVNLRTRKVTLGGDFGAMPPHLKRGDSFDVRVRFRAGADAASAPLQLQPLDALKFGVREKGRYDGALLIYGESDLAWDDALKCYHIALQLDGDALRAALQSALTQGFDDGGYDCDHGDGGTETIASTAGQTTTTVTRPTAVQPTPLTDVEFMAEWEWTQNTQTMSSETFALFVARDVIYNTPSGVIFQPPPEPSDFRFLAPLPFAGVLKAGQVFGFFRAPLPLEILGVQVFVQVPDPAAGFRVQMTDGAAAELAGGQDFFADVPAGSNFVEVRFGHILTLAAGDVVRAKLKGYAGDLAAWATVNLICRQYNLSSPSGPSGPPGVTAADATTLVPGSQATAQITGSTLHLGLPRGDNGQKGDKGDKGDKGSDGQKGRDGQKGDRGEKGDRGMEGPRGADGSATPVQPGYFRQDWPEGTVDTIMYVTVPYATVMAWKCAWSTPAPANEIQGQRYLDDQAVDTLQLNDYSDVLILPLTPGRHKLSVHNHSPTAQGASKHFEVLTV